MDENVENTNSLEEQFLNTEILNALAKHGARDTEFLREHIRALAEVVWLRNQPHVSINADSGACFPLDEYVGDLKRHPKFASKFNQVPKISRADQTAINKNVAKIAAGEVEVVDEG